MAEQQSSYFTSGSKQLPYSEVVDVAALSRLFEDTTNSYKYVFFISILDILYRRQFDVSDPITFEDLVIEMLANAWYPHTYFNLSFGKKDQITKRLNLLTLEISEPILKFTDTDKSLLRATIANQNLKETIRTLRRYVPFHLIVPFFDEELRNIPDKNRGSNLSYAMPKVAESHFGDRKPLYRFDSDNYSSCSAIICHPSWAAYLEKHYRIVRGWASWEWLDYMQKRNPNTPNLIHKLFAPTRRESLATQTKYWKTVLDKAELRCIYSKQNIDPGRFSLDHYLPWSFVAHDQLWNLVPTVPEVNSSKSNDLPPLTSLQDFVEAQHLGLRIFHENKPQKTWEKVAEDYVAGLRVHDQSDLLDLEKLQNAYADVMQPLMALATNQGFKVWQAS